jgi:hypothetical protein
MIIYRILLTILFISGIATGIALAAYYSGQLDGVYVTAEINPEAPISREAVSIIFHFQNATTFEAIDVGSLTVEISRNDVLDTIPVKQKPHKGHYEVNYTFSREGRYFVTYAFRYDGERYESGFYIDVKPNFFVTDKSKSEYGIIGIIAISGILVLIIYQLYRRR